VAEASRSPAARHDPSDASCVLDSSDLTATNGPILLQFASSLELIYTPGVHSYFQQWVPWLTDVMWEKLFPLVQSCCPINRFPTWCCPSLLVYHPCAHPISEELPTSTKNYILCNTPLVVERHKQPWFPQLLPFFSRESRNSQVYSLKERQEGEVRSNLSGNCRLGSQPQFLKCLWGKFRAGLSGMLTWELSAGRDGKASLHHSAEISLMLHGSPGASDSGGT